MSLSRYIFVKIGYCILRIMLYIADIGNRKSEDNTPRIS